MVRPRLCVVLLAVAFFQITSAQNENAEVATSAPLEAPSANAVPQSDGASEGDKPAIVPPVEVPAKEAPITQEQENSPAEPTHDEPVKAVPEAELTTAAEPVAAAAAEPVKAAEPDLAEPVEATAEPATETEPVVSSSDEAATTEEVSEAEQAMEDQVLEKPGKVGDTASIASNNTATNEPESSPELPDEGVGHEGSGFGDSSTKDEELKETALETPVDCVLNKTWTYDPDCTKTCGGGLGKRTRRVITEAANGGKPCPALVEDIPCNTHSCRLTVLKAGELVSWPMPRNTIHLANDGDMSTWTYTTAAWCEHNPFWVGLSFPYGALVSGLRMWKRHHYGKRKDCGMKDLEVMYTSDGAHIPPSERNYLRVQGLHSGFDDLELLNATQVEASTAKVISETHNSETAGWGSLSFNTVNATAIVLQVESPDPHYNHFCMAELQAFQDPDAATLTKQFTAPSGMWTDI